MGGNFSNGSRFGERFDRYKSGDGTASRNITSGRHYTFGLRKRDKNYKNRRNMGGEIRKKIIAWDVAPGKSFFDEIFRVSRNQIIWGVITSNCRQQDVF